MGVYRMQALFTTVLRLQLSAQDNGLFPGQLGSVLFHFK